ncbi:unnamed protein product [Ectocarpus sp. CCAP 1310/34]|nr:unnamed protein product [Ectocarpus sp. CCAP 1310/34]
MRRRPENGEEMHNAFGSQGRGGSSTGGGYYSAPTDRIRETNHNIMEMQNNAHIDDLSDQVSRLKHLTIDIGQEVRSQNDLISGMEGQMFDARGLLGGTLRRINTMMAQGGSRHMCYLVAFIVFTFTAIWYILKHTRGGR